ncbi:AAA family ATPase [Cellvibrio sp. PSBB006]|uniref:AAA family ATPase n=1 Tax=Cellvibrio sp. PSBB006 TaxID=1987723 RepID=UPI0012FA674A|nr:AAA family ATPase [Cellvibrio sp. PSBB006]
MSENGIILIGPIGAGKSTIGKLLSKRLNMPQCSIDKYRWGYYEEMGYDNEYAQRLKSEEDINLNKHLIDQKSNYELAKHIVYTDGSEPEDTALEVLAKIYSE